MSEKKLLEMDSSASTAPLHTPRVEIRAAEGGQVSPRHRRRVLKIVLAIVPLLILLAVVVAIIIILYPSTSSDPVAEPTDVASKVKDECRPSAEANHSGLTAFLVKLEKEYYRLHPEKFPSKKMASSREIRAAYRPYDARPAAIKNKTDTTKRLREELGDLMKRINESKLKLRERSALHLSYSYLLQHSFDWVPYERDYYAGDWMLEPNIYCWRPICDVLVNLAGLASTFKPTDVEGVERLLEMLGWHNDTIVQYINNLKLGVRTGMVGSKTSCRAGLRALRRPYRNVFLYNETGILKEFFAEQILMPMYLSGITPETNETWKSKHGIGVRESIKRGLVELLGRPLLALLRYMEFDHLRHCVPDDEFSGLHSLPLTHKYVDGVMVKSDPALRTLPTGELLNGSQSYLRLLSFFTPNNETPEHLRSEGIRRLSHLLLKVKEIAKNYTKDANETTAVLRFREVLDSQDQAYNRKPFPANESDEGAFTACGLSARQFCPKRWQAFQRMKEAVEKVSIRVQPKLRSLFYYSGDKKTAPSCGVAVEPEFNPDISFHGYHNGKDSGYEYIPFFMNNLGPKYTAYTTTVHEEFPGHHLEVVGFEENFSDTCGDPISFLRSPNYVPAFTEGWATYVEYPLVYTETDLYTGNDERALLLQKYGMYKYQILAALRSVVDSGLHYFGMSRSEAVALYDEYAWDRTDLVDKDIMRIQGSPGIVSSYMSSQAWFERLLRLAQEELGPRFSFPEFHYQVLRQGEITMGYLEKHIRWYIDCRKDSRSEGCSEILE